MGRLITSPGLLKNVQGQINDINALYQEIKDNNLKPLTITLDPVTNANGSVSVVTEDERVTEDMKAIAIEVGTPEVFKAPISVTTASGEVTLTCDNATGTSTVAVTFIKTSPVSGGEDYPPAITSTEFDILADRIGALSTLETSDKTDVVSAVNEVLDDVNTLNSNLSDIKVKCIGGLSKTNTNGETFTFTMTKTYLITILRDSQPGSLALITAGFGDAQYLVPNNSSITITRNGSEVTITRTNSKWEYALVLEFY